MVEVRNDCRKQREVQGSSPEKRKHFEIKEKRDTSKKDWEIAAWKKSRFTGSQKKNVFKEERVTNCVKCCW